MVNETPHLYFMPFWADDDAQNLASSMRAALDVMTLERGSRG